MMSDRPKSGGYIVDAWLVIVLAFCYGGALAGVHVGLSGRIAENKRNETYDQIPSLVPGADRDRILEHEVIGTNGRMAIVYEALDADQRRLGWVLPGHGQGFADRIDLLVGLDADLTTITGMFVLAQKETPGLGNYITEAERFRDQFAGKQVDPKLVVVKVSPDPKHEILALTGATISSESVSDIINKTIDELKPAIQQIGHHEELSSSVSRSAPLPDPTPVR